MTGPNFARLISCAFGWSELKSKLRFGSVTHFRTLEQFKRRLIKQKRISSRPLIIMERTSHFPQTA